jgi:hypothetical protein
MVARVILGRSLHPLFRNGRMAALLPKEQRSFSLPLAYGFTANGQPVFVTERSQRSAAFGIRFKRDHACSKSKKRVGVLANISPHVEHQRSGAHKLAVEVTARSPVPSPAPTENGLIYLPDRKICSGA